MKIEMSLMNGEEIVQKTEITEESGNTRMRTGSKNYIVDATPDVVAKEKLIGGITAITYLNSLVPEGNFDLNFKRIK